jgi:hypothetical protein
MLASTAFAQGNFQAVDTPPAIFENGYIQVIGESEAGQSRYAAKRAAKVVAQRDLVEIVKGLNLIGASTVQDGMLVSDQVRTTVKGFLQGAVVVSEEYVTGEGFARVALRLNLRGSNSLYDSLAPVLQQPPAELKVQSMPEFKPQAAAAPAPQPQMYDGLIVVVEGTGFKPALANRIITENQDILFEPSKVSPQMLIERGCGGYTTTQDKAKALLSSWGSKSPLIVKCVKVMKGTEAVVSVQDATVIFEQNQKTNMLPQAKVVFVL